MLCTVGSLIRTPISNGLVNRWRALWADLLGTCQPRRQAGNLFRCFPPSRQTLRKLHRQEDGPPARWSCHRLVVRNLSHQIFCLPGVAQVSFSTAAMSPSNKFGLIECQEELQRRQISLQVPLLDGVGWRSASPRRFSCAEAMERLIRRVRPGTIARICRARWLLTRTGRSVPMTAVAEVGGVPGLSSADRRASTQAGVSDDINIRPDSTQGTREGGGRSRTLSVRRSLCV